MSQRAPFGAGVLEGVDDVRRHEHEGSRPGGHALELRTDLEDELAVEDEEDVDVLLVDVRRRAFLAARSASR